MRVENGVLYEVTDQDINPDGSFTFPEGITSIGHSAFIGCTSLKEIEIPEGVTDIYGRVFSGCSSLKEIKIPESVTNIGSGSFSGCSSLEEIEIPEGVTIIRAVTFLGCSSLNSIKIPEGVTWIEDGAFVDCSSLNNIKIPKRVTGIGSGAFSGCSSLEEIKVPDGVTWIGDEVFSNCKNLTNVEIPGEITDFGEDVFSGCTSLKKIKIPMRPGMKVGYYGINFIYLTIEDDFLVFSKESIDDKYTGIVPFDIDSALEHLELLSDKWLEYGYLPSQYINSRYQQSDITLELVNGLKKASISIWNSGITQSFNYNRQSMDMFLYKMMRSIGAEEIQKMLRIDEISETDLRTYYGSYSEIYEKYTQKKFLLSGIDGLTIGIIKRFDKSLGTLKEKERFEIYKRVNSYLIKGDYAELNRLFEDFIGKEKLAESKENIRNKIIESINENLKIKNDRLSQELRIPEAQLNVVKRMMKKYIIENGSMNVENIEKWFRENTGHGTDFAANWIQIKKGTIVNLINESITENKDMLSNEKMIFEILKQGKEHFQKPWIRNIIGTENQVEFTREELQKLFGEEYVLAHENEYKSKLILRPGASQEEFYKELNGKRIKGIITYEQIETMFGGIDVDSCTEEELKNFKEYYKKYRDEILSNVEVQEMLPAMFMRVKDGMQIDSTPQMLVSKIKEAKNEISYNPQYGDSELAQSFLYSIATPNKENQVNYWENYKELYEKMKRRESITIPPIRVGTRETGKYFGKVLRADDPLAIAIGSITNCCQEFGNAGEQPMIHSANEKNGGVFAIFDEKGKVVAQSWVWRMGSRLCFDNIEMSNDREANQSEIYEIYKKASEDAIKIDTNMMNKLLKDGKITSEQYMEYSLREVTVGMGYINGVLSEKLRENPKGSIVSVNRSGYSDALEETRVLFERNEDEIRKNVENVEQDISADVIATNLYKNAVPYGYEKLDEIEFISSEYIGRKLDQIKEIEKIAFVDNQHMLQDCNSVQDISRQYGIPVEDLRLVTNRDSTFYMLYGDKGESTVYIADLAMLNGLNSQNRATTKSELADDDPRKRGDLLVSSAEALIASYQVLLDAAKRGKSIEADATNNTSLINIRNMERNGLIVVQEEENYNDGVDKTKISFDVNVDEMQEALEKLSEKLKKRQETMVTYQPLSDTDKESDDKER